MAILQVEPDGKTEGEEETRIPMDEDEDHQNNFGDSKSIWKVGPGFGFLEKLRHPV